MTSTRFGLIGAGAMGHTVARAFSDGIVEGNLSAVYDIDTESASELASAMSPKPVVVQGISELIECCDFLVEAASQRAVRDCILPALKAGKSVLVMSVGALLDEGLYKEMVGVAEETGASVYLPSGALAGVDGLLSAECTGVDEVMLRTIKPPRGLMGVKYLEDRGIDVDALEKETVVFDGSAQEAARLFPKNINVSAIISLAAGKTARVQIVADPKAQTNTHVMTAKGGFGSIETRTSNVPSPDNPRTSHLAALSVVAALKKITGAVKIGN